MQKDQLHVAAKLLKTHSARSKMLKIRCHSMHSSGFRVNLTKLFVCWKQTMTMVVVESERPTEKKTLNCSAVSSCLAPEMLYLRHFEAPEEGTKGWRDGREKNMPPKQLTNTSSKETQKMREKAKIDIEKNW